MLLTTTTADRDVALNFATTLRACRALAKAQGRAGAEAVRTLAAATRLFARQHRAKTHGMAAIDRVHNLAVRALARGIAPPSVHAWSANRYDRVRLEANRHV